MILKVMVTKGGRATEMDFPRVEATLRWIEISLNRQVAIAVQPENVREELQLIMEAFVIA
jgi:hypothetical protein